MKRKLISLLLILSTSGVASAISLYPDVQVSVGQKTRAVWAVIVYGYYHGQLQAEDEDLYDLINPLTLDHTSSAAWPDTSAMTSFFNQHPRTPAKLRALFISMRDRVELEKGRLNAAGAGSDWDGA